MKKFRLKRDAVPFFNKKYTTEVQEFDVWKSWKIDINALEEVESVFMTYGHKTSENVNSMCEWGNKDGAKFFFTLNLPTMSRGQFEAFKQPKVLRQFMNDCQKTANIYFEGLDN